MSAYLAHQLRESSPYLSDQGWHQVASLMRAAADELDYLHACVYELETSAPDSMTQEGHQRRKHG